jgi:hypothetical protein
VVNHFNGKKQGRQGFFKPLLLSVTQFPFCFFLNQRARKKISQRLEIQLVVLDLQLRMV